MPADTLNAQAKALADARREMDDYADGHVSGSHARFVRCREDVARALGVPWETPEALGPAVPEPPGWGPLVAAVRAVVAERDDLRAQLAGLRTYLTRSIANDLGGMDEACEILDSLPAQDRATVDAWAREMSEPAYWSKEVADLQGQLAEAKAALANERGDGAGPTPGWRYVDDDDDGSGHEWQLWHVPPGNDTLNGDTYSVVAVWDEDEPRPAWMMLKGGAKLHIGPNGSSMVRHAREGMWLITRHLQEGT